MNNRIKEFIEEYFSQDNRATAYPIFYSIMDVDWRACYHFEDADRYVFVYDSEELYTEDTLKELFKKLLIDEYGYDFKFPPDFDLEHVDEHYCETFIDLNEFATGIFGQKKEYVYKNSFLLLSEAEDHLKKNHYHYSSEAQVFCDHSWRAPRQEEFFNELRKYFKES